MSDRANQNDILISVIVPVYQSEEYLSRCIDSIINQTYSSLEIILIDDGSSDNSPKICDHYQKMDERVVVIHQKNTGVSRARNAGLSFANGDYITFVDSDDYLEENMYNEMMNKVIEYNCDVVMCDCIKEHPERCVLFSHDIRSGYYTLEQLREEYYPHLLMTEDVELPATISNWLLLINRKIVINNNLEYVNGVTNCEDLLFGAQVLFCARSFYYMKDKAYYHYVINNNSASRTFYTSRWSGYLELYQCATSYFEGQMVFDFEHQLDLMLLFFVQNTINEIKKSTNMSKTNRIEFIKSVLYDSRVKTMLNKLSVFSLPITWKGKIGVLLLKLRLVHIIYLL